MQLYHLFYFLQLTFVEYFLLQYFTGLECGHKFCMQCWGDYLTTKIIEEGMGQVLARVGTGHETKCLFKQTTVPPIN